MKTIITTCSGREQLVKNLVKELPDAIVNFDDFTDSGKLKTTAYYNWQRSLSIAGNEACIQLEDDILLCNDFKSKINEVIQKHPDSLIQFFSMKNKDLTQGARWESGSTFISMLCYYLPKGMAKDILEHSTEYLKHTKYTQSPTDMCVRDFLVKNKLKYYLHVPNLVDHLPVVSAINPRRPKNRVSKTFVK